MRVPRPHSARVVAPLAELGSLGDDLRDQLLSLTAGRAVADRDHADLVLAYQVLEQKLGVGPPILRRMRVDDPWSSKSPLQSSTASFAPGLEAWVDGHHDLLGDRRLQEQAAQVFGEDLDGVSLGRLGQIAAHLALHAG